MRRIWAGAFGLVVLSMAGCGEPQAKQNSPEPEKTPDLLRDAAGRVDDYSIKVSRAIDGDAVLIGQEVKPTTVKEVFTQKRPDELTSDGMRGSTIAKRFGPFELTKWEVTAKAIEVYVRADEDYYLTLVDDSGIRIVAELPDPAKCQGSPFIKEITEARIAVEKTFKPNPTPQKFNHKVKLIGVGFFGKASRNDSNNSGARLMPVLHIEFLN